MAKRTAPIKSNTITKNVQSPNVQSLIDIHLLTVKCHIYWLPVGFNFMKLVSFVDARKPRKPLPKSKGGKAPIKQNFRKSIEKKTSTANLVQSYFFKQENIALSKASTAKVTRLLNEHWVFEEKLLSYGVDVSVYHHLFNKTFEPHQDRGLVVGLKGGEEPPPLEAIV